jgi:hypothetical protein
MRDGSARFAIRDGDVSPDGDDPVGAAMPRRARDRHPYGEATGVAPPASTLHQGPRRGTEPVWIPPDS